MIRLSLSRGLAALVDDEDFELISARNWYALKSGRTFYAVSKARRADGSRYTIRMHRLLMAPPAGMIPDHINGNGLDNRRANLRNIPASRNAWNMHPFPGLTSRFKGVCWDRGKKRWRSLICCEGRQRHLGYFRSETDAARAYNAAAIDAFGDMAKINEL